MQKAEITDTAVLQEYLKVCINKLSVFIIMVLLSALLWSLIFYLSAHP